MILNRGLIFVFFVFAIVNTVTSQKVDLAALQAQYPHKQLLYLNFDLEVNIEIEDGELQISETNRQSKLLLTSEGKQYEEESIPYYETNEIVDIEANSKVPNGKRYKTYKVNDFNTIKTISERYFYDDSYAVQFNYPEAREGTICNVAYTSVIDNPIFMPSFYLANYVPIKELNIKLVYDEDVDLLIHEFNIDEPLQFATSKKGGKIIKELKLKDIETIDIEGGGRSFQAIVPHIALAISSYEVDGEKKKVMGGLDDLFSNYSEFIGEVNPETEKDFASKVDSITNGIDSEEEKVEAIYSWVKNNIKYIAFEDNMGGFIPRDPQLVFDRKFGDCKDMSSIIVRMLDKAGIKGNFAWTGTRDLPYKYSDACGTFIDNHMIAVYYSENQKKYYYLDATHEYLPFGLIPSNIQEKQVLLYQSPTSYKVLTSGVTACEANLNYEECRLRIEGEKLVGHFNIKLDGYQIVEYKNIFERMTKEQLEKRYQTYFAKGSNKSTVTAIEADHNARPLDINYDITIDEYLSQAGDEIYVNMNLDKVLEGQKMPESRKQDVDLNQTYNFKKSYVLEVPEGYEVTYVPDDVSFGDDKFSCSIKYSKTGKEVVYDYDMCLDIIWLKPEHFSEWNTFIKNLKKSYRENIILTKK